MTFGEAGQPTYALRAELEALLSTPVYVRIMSEEGDEASATYLNNMLQVIDGTNDGTDQNADDFGLEDGGIDAALES